MKFLIVIGFLIGLGGVLTAAGLAPFGAQDRVESKTSVANNGARLETFVIRLPADRIVSTGSGSAMADSSPATRLDPPAALTGGDFTVEQFKLRNIDGEVIGVAMRHFTSTDSQGAVTWALSIPSRGTLVWNTDVEGPGELADGLVAAGVRSGIPWQGEMTIPIPAGDVLTGTQEFSSSSGTIEETWEITGVGDDGELRGTIVLDTIVQRST